MKITYSPNHEFNQGGDQYQACKTFANKTLLNRVLYYTFFPHNFMKPIRSWYEIYGFDCEDSEYSQKLIKLEKIAKKYGGEVVENEDIFISLSDDTSGEDLKKINEDIEKALT